MIKIESQKCQILTAEGRAETAEQECSSLTEELAKKSTELDSVVEEIGKLREHGYSEAQKHSVEVRQTERTWLF